VECINLCSGLISKNNSSLSHYTLQQSLGDNNKFADYLTKVFKKKIKRSKKKENAEGGKKVQSLTAEDIPKSVGLKFQTREETSKQVLALD